MFGSNIRAHNFSFRIISLDGLIIIWNMYTWSATSILGQKVKLLIQKCVYNLIFTKKKFLLKL